MMKVGGLTAFLLLLRTIPLGGQTPVVGPSVRAFLFGDVQYSETDLDRPAGFHLGQIVAHASAILSDRVVFFGELSMTGRDSGYAVEVERAILRYEVNDAFKVSAGRYHTPISYWNTAFHHGVWLQGSVARPESVRFGSRFVPIHFVGAMVEGRLPGSPLSYGVGVGNGRADNIARPGDAGDANGSRAALASVSLQPSELPGARLGGSVYFDDVPRDGDTDADERIVSAHAVWERGALDLIGEYLRVRHAPGGGNPTTSSDAMFFHAGVRLPGRLSMLTPYVRWERMNIADADVVFSGVVSDYEGILGGIRYDFSDLAAIKAEYRSEELGGAGAQGSLYIQASFAVSMFAG
ncbi:MAG: hypothetical protein P8170_04640 [Gemmatimonadota bacterium]|jgi:hypothetical protein